MTISRKRKQPESEEQVLLPPGAYEPHWGIRAQDEAEKIGLAPPSLERRLELALLEAIKAFKRSGIDYGGGAFLKSHLYYFSGGDRLRVDRWLDAKREAGILREIRVVSLSNCSMIVLCKAYDAFMEGAISRFDPTDVVAAAAKVFIQRHCKTAASFPNLRGDGLRVAQKNQQLFNFLVRQSVLWPPARNGGIYFSMPLLGNLARQLGGGRNEFLQSLRRQKYKEVGLEVMFQKVLKANIPPDFVAFDLSGLQETQIFTYSGKEYIRSLGGWSW
mmetsp:Transcript_45815/g.118407  ORF Transcript_45815/g.118407 Transcript_45815/m.118407 type:complete len:274 (-) Transcript_45815:264-1085(-)